MKKLIWLAFLLPLTAFANPFTDEFCLDPDGGLEDDLCVGFNSDRVRLDALEAQVLALENSALNPSVEGRTYCHVVDFLIMSGFDPAQTERLSRLVIRRKTTFSGGSFSADLVSSVIQIQNDAGTVLQFPTSPVDPVTGTYTQTGNRLDMVFVLDTNFFATWYVSKDGSVIYGTALNQPPPEVIGVDTVTSGVIRSWILIENDDCAGEIIQ